MVGFNCGGGLLVAVAIVIVLEFLIEGGWVRSLVGHCIVSRAREGVGMISPAVTHLVGSEHIRVT